MPKENQQHPSLLSQIHDEIRMYYPWLGNLLEFFSDTIEDIRFFWNDEKQDKDINSKLEQANRLEKKQRLWINILTIAALLVASTLILVLVFNPLGLAASIAFGLLIATALIIPFAVRWAVSFANKISSGIEFNENLEKDDGEKLSSAKRSQLLRKLGLEDSWIHTGRYFPKWFKNAHLRWASGDSKLLAQQNFRRGFVAKSSNKKMTGTVLGSMMGLLMGYSCVVLGVPFFWKDFSEATETVKKGVFWMQVGLFTWIGRDMGQDLNYQMQVNRERIFAELHSTNDPFEWKLYRVARMGIVAGGTGVGGLFADFAKEGIIFISYAVAGFFSGFARGFYNGFKKGFSRVFARKQDDAAINPELNAQNQNSTSADENDTLAITHFQISNKKLAQIVNEAIHENLAEGRDKLSVFEKQRLENKKKTTENLKEKLRNDIVSGFKKEISSENISRNIAKSINVKVNEYIKRKIFENYCEMLTGQLVLKIKKGIKENDIKHIIRKYENADEKLLFLNRVFYSYDLDFSDTSINIVLNNYAISIAEQLDSKNDRDYFNQNLELFSIFLRVKLEKNESLIQKQEIKESKALDFCINKPAVAIRTLRDSWETLNQFLTRIEEAEAFEDPERVQEEREKSLWILQAESKTLDYDKLELKDKFDDSDKEHLKIFWLERYFKYEVKLQRINEPVHSLFENINYIFLWIRGKTWDPYYEKNKSFKVQQYIFQFVVFGIPALILGLTFSVIQTILLLPAVNFVWTAIKTAARPGEETPALLNNLGQWGFIPRFLYNLSPVPTYAKIIENTPSDSSLAHWTYTLLLKAPAQYLINIIKFGKNAYSDRFTQYQKKYDEAKQMVNFLTTETEMDVVKNNTNEYLQSYIKKAKTRGEYEKNYKPEEKEFFSLFPDHPHAQYENWPEPKRPITHSWSRFMTMRSTDEKSKETIRNLKTGPQDPRNKLKSATEIPYLCKPPAALNVAPS